MNFLENLRHWSKSYYEQIQEEAQEGTEENQAVEEGTEEGKMVLEPGEYYIYTADNYLDLVLAITPTTFQWITFDGEVEDLSDCAPCEIHEPDQFRKLSPLEKALL